MESVHRGKGCTRLAGGWPRAPFGGGLGAQRGLSEDETVPDFYGDDLAYVHHVGFSRVAEAGAAALLERLSGVGVHAGTVVEWGAGSGVSSAKLIEAGFGVHGFDASPSMVSLARLNAPAGRFVCANFADAQHPPCVAVTAFGEGLNYLSRGRSLTALFRRAYRALEPGGIFIADWIVHGGAVMKYQGHRLGHDWAVLVDVTEDDEAILRKSTVFRRVGEAYRRSSEEHRVHALKRKSVERSLREAGFNRIEFSNRYGNYDLPARRKAVVARKR